MELSSSFLSAIHFSDGKSILCLQIIFFLGDAAGCFSFCLFCFFLTFVKLPGLPKQNFISKIDLSKSECALYTSSHYIWTNTLTELKFNLLLTMMIFKKKNSSSSKLNTSIEATSLTHARVGNIIKEAFCCFVLNRMS